MPLGFRDLQRKHSIESFVSPSAQWIESASSSQGTLRRLRSINQLQPRVTLPDSPSSLVTRRATVHVRQKTFAWWTWTRQSLRLTKRTISLHRYHDLDGALDIIVLCKVRHVGPVSKPPRCLKIETIENKTYFIAFEREEELHSWLVDLRLVIRGFSSPINVKHLFHVGPDEVEKYHLAGFPQHWQSLSPSLVHETITREMVEAALPEICISGHEPIIDLGDALRYRPASPAISSSHFEEDNKAVLETNINNRPITHRVLNMQPLRIITEDFSSCPSVPSASHTTTEDSHLTPLLTPDKSPLTPDKSLLMPEGCPVTPFRESPYIYGESDAQDLSGQIQRQSNWPWPDAQGGYADIWRAQWHCDTGVCLPVAVKVLRVLSQDENVRTKIQKRLRKEVSVWHQLRHQNIVQMYGTCEGFGPFPSMVSAWYENGNVNTYLRKLGDAANVEMRLRLLTEVARGLNYLHTFAFPVAIGPTKTSNIVHGDLKGANILVNGNGEAALADFGLSSIIKVAGESSASTCGGGSVRWMAPELLHARDFRSKTCASDTYSYGSVILEIITGELPYNDIANDMQVINQLMQGIKPRRPLSSTLNPSIWDLIERCWSTHALDRPQMAFVLSRMEKFYRERMKSMLSDDKLAYAV